MNVEIRPFAAADLEVIQRIRAVAFELIFRSFREIVGETAAALAFERADAEQARVCVTRMDHQVFLALIDNDVVGFVSFSLSAEKRIGEIGLNAVHPDHAGRGVGTALYDFAIDQMRRSGMLSQQLELAVTLVTCRRGVLTRRRDSVLRYQFGCIDCYR
jgi:ribosomal protein S18 acetylase RimI-like enzyme